jgi:hypothetical protein
MIAGLPAENQLAGLIVNFNMLRLLETGNGNGSEFSGKDSYDRYIKNLNSQPESWVWRNKTVKYSLNRQKYRAPEWQDCDWSNSILILGCSMVYGVGVDDADTLGHNISKNLDVPVINLGQGGTGIAFMWANSIILREHNISPRAVVYVWPDRSRQTEFLSEHTTISHGPWNIEDSWMMPLAVHNKHNYHWAQYTIRNLRQLWSCPVIEASWYEDMIAISGGLHLPFEDFARDEAHPGPNTLGISANIISNKIIQHLR